MEYNLRPIVKWAGGKRQIMGDLLVNFPKRFGNYYEPFLGGASVFMEMYNRKLLVNKNVYLSDLMSPLVNLYTVIKNKPEELMNFLDDMFKDARYDYYELRDSYNTIHLNLNNVQLSVEYAGLFLLLNKLGFNGMYRENSKGLFNVPQGKQQTPLIYSKDTVINLSNVLREPNIEICCDGYQIILQTAKKGDFIYMDPPYHETFSQYNKEPFGAKEHEELRNVYAQLTERGCKVAVSNNDTAFIRELYSSVPSTRFIEISTTRRINCNFEDRQDLKKELLIVNYRNEV